MLRTLLKRFIITCTRIAREKFSVSHEKEKSFDIVRQYYVLVDSHFKEKKMVQDYADMLHRSPKTLSNLFMSYGLPSPYALSMKGWKQKQRDYFCTVQKVPKK